MDSGLVDQVFGTRDQGRRVHSSGDSPIAAHLEPGKILDESVVKPQLWTILERLKAEENPTLPSAQAEVQALLKLSGNTDARQEIMRALRTEQPAHFKFPEIRAAALNALAPYVKEDKSLLPVYIEELEDHPGYSEPVKIALSVINRVDEIDNSDYSDRLLRLIARADPDKKIKEIFEQLHPHLKYGACSNNIVQELLSAVTSAYEKREEPNHAELPLKALAVSRSSGAIELLAKSARQDIFEPYGFEKAFGAMDGAQVIAGIPTIIGLLGSLGTGSILPLAFGLGGGVGVFCVGIPLVVQLCNQHKNRIENLDVASKAGRALVYAMPDGQAETSALNILQDPKTSEQVKQAIIGGLRNEVRQVDSPGMFIYALTSSEAPVREALLGALANNRGTDVEEAVQKCTNDRDSNVRRLAYEIIDSWGKGDKTGKAVPVNGLRPEEL